MKITFCHDRLEAFFLSVSRIPLRKKVPRMVRDCLRSNSLKIEVFAGPASGHTLLSMILIDSN